MPDRTRVIPKCIFCCDLLDGQTKPEHVLHNAFGGRKTTTRVICSGCNNTFGGGIDRTLTEQFEVIRNLLQLQSGSGSTAPMLRKIQAGSQTVNAHGDGTFELITKPFTVTKRGDGTFDLQIAAQSLDDIDRLIPHIAASIGIPELDLRRQLVRAPAKQVEQRVGPVPFHLEFGGEEALRSAAKSCLVLWALTVGNEEVRGDGYKAARTFVTHGDENFRQSQAQLDSRPLDEVERVKQSYGPVFNLIYVRSNEYGRVIGHFTFYNLIAFQLVLADSGGTPNKKIGLISNPLHSKTWSDKAAEFLDIPFEWLNKPVYQPDLAKERFSNVMQTYVDIYTPKEWHRLMKETFDEHGIGENDPIPPTLLNGIVSKVSDRIARHMLNMPSEETITAEELQKALGGTLSK